MSVFLFSYFDRDYSSFFVLTWIILLTYLFQGDRGINPSHPGAVAGTFKEEKVYFLSAVEDLKTRNQWKMQMKGVIKKNPIWYTLLSWDSDYDTPPLFSNPTSAGAKGRPRLSAALTAWRDSINLRKIENEVWIISI